MPTTPVCSSGSAWGNSSTNDLDHLGAGRNAFRTLKNVRYQKMKIVAIHARQHHRHRALIRYSDSNCSHDTNPIPNSVPASKVSQYHRGNRAPASRLMPTQITMP